jgi:hypothetical protein
MHYEGTWFESKLSKTGLTKYWVALPATAIRYRLAGFYYDRLLQHISLFIVSEHSTVTSEVDKAS